MLLCSELEPKDTMTSVLVILSLKQKCKLKNPEGLGNRRKLISSFLRNVSLSLSSTEFQTKMIPLKNIL